MNNRKALIVLLKISQNSQESTSPAVSFWTKLFGFNNFIKTRLQHKCFPVSFEKKIKNTLFTEHLWATVSRISLLFI